MSLHFIEEESEEVYRHSGRASSRLLTPSLHLSSHHPLCPCICPSFVHLPHTLSLPPPPSSLPPPISPSIPPSVHHPSFPQPSLPPSIIHSSTHPLYPFILPSVRPHVRILSSFHPSIHPPSSIPPSIPLSFHLSVPPSSNHLWITWVPGVVTGNS